MHLRNKTTAVAALALLAGCGKTAAAPAADPRVTTQTTYGFTSHAWCRAYVERGQGVQDRVLFSDGGTLDYQKFAFKNSRGTFMEQATGQWQLDGPVLTLWMNQKRYIFQAQYMARDTRTGADRVYVTNSQGTTIYDPCH